MDKVYDCNTSPHCNCDEEICMFFDQYFIYIDWATIALLGIATLIILVGSVIHIGNNKKAAIKTLTMCASICLVLCVSYFVLASDIVHSSYKPYNITAETSQFVGMGLWSFYILAGFATVAIIVTELLQRFSK